MNTFDKIKSILTSIPIVYYLLFFVIIICIHLYTNYSLQIYNSKIKKNAELEDTVLFKEQTVRYRYNILKKILGIPPIIETNDNLYTESVMWRLNLDMEDFTYGKYNGLDLIRLTGYVARKNHPLPAPVFVIVGKYINVPEHLYGPLKYASPTINIEQIYIPKKHNLYYEKTGEKKISLVTGSCASVTISAITIKFVEDMIEKFKENMDTSLDTHIKFRKEYNLRVLRYLCGKGIKPEIPWYDPLNFKEESIYNTNSDACGLLRNTDSLPLFYKEDNVNKVLESIHNNISNDQLTKADIKNIFKETTNQNKKNKNNDMNITGNMLGGNCSILGPEECRKKTDCIWNNDCIDNICPDAKKKNTCEENAKYADLCFWDGYNGAKPGDCKPKPA